MYIYIYKYKKSGSRRNFETAGARGRGREGRWQWTDAIREVRSRRGSNDDRPHCLSARAQVGRWAWLARGERDGGAR
jgi:hypothetical protein